MSVTRRGQGAKVKTVAGLDQANGCAGTAAHIGRILAGIGRAVKSRPTKKAPPGGGAWWSAGRRRGSLTCPRGGRIRGRFLAIRQSQPRKRTPRHMLTRCPPTIRTAQGGPGGRVALFPLRQHLVERRAARRIRLRLPPCSILPRVKVSWSHHRTLLGVSRQRYIRKRLWVWLAAAARSGRSRSAARKMPADSAAERIRPGPAPS